MGRQQSLNPSDATDVNRDLATALGKELKNVGVLAP